MFICPFGTKKLNDDYMIPLMAASVGLSAMSAIQQQSNYEEEVKLRKEFFEQDFQNQIALMGMQNKYNSPANQTGLMRAAGLNPDLNSISAQPSVGASLPSAQDKFAEIPNVVQTASESLMRNLPTVMSTMSSFLDLQRKDLENKGLSSAVASQISQDQNSIQQDVYNFLSGVMSPEDIETLQSLPTKERMSYIGGSDAALAMSPVSGKDIPEGVRSYYTKAVERAISSPGFYEYYWNTVSSMQDANADQAVRRKTGNDLTSPEYQEGSIQEAFVKYLELVYLADKEAKELSYRQNSVQSDYYGELLSSGYGRQSAVKDIESLDKSELVAGISSKLANAIDKLINSDRFVDQALGYLAYYMIFGSGSDIVNGAANRGVMKLF